MLHLYKKAVNTSHIHNLNKISTELTNIYTSKTDKINISVSNEVTTNLWKGFRGNSFSIMLCSHRFIKVMHTQVFNLS